MRGPIRVYADTSVFGGFFDDEFKEASRQFFKQTQAGQFKLLVSAVIDKELQEAPPQVKRLYRDMLHIVEIAEISLEALDLQKAYLTAAIVTERWMDDALHVAIATTAKADMIVSWNFQHLVHFQKIRQYNAVNRLNGWSEIEIYSPKEIIAYED